MCVELVRKDPECVEICKAIDRIPGIQTIGSCSGHGERPFIVLFECEDLIDLPILLYNLMPYHVGFLWRCRPYTDCIIAPVRFAIESLSKGDTAYAEAAEITKEINSFMDEHPGGVEDLDREDLDHQEGEDG